VKKKIEQIRAAKTWQERADIAANQMPGTSFDRIFEKAKWAKDFETKNVNITRQLHEQLGQWLAWLIQNREIPTLHNMADALAELKRHKPKRDYDLEALFFMTGICPPGWTKTYVKCDPKTGKFMFNMKTGRPIFAAPPGMNDPLAMRDIKKQIAATDPNFSEDTWETRRRKIQRYARELKIRLDETPGYPPEKMRHNPA